MERKKAIEVVKKNWPDSRFTWLREALETLIPELKESEDERIKREIIDYLSTVDDKELIPYESWIAWLEKQGKQKPAEYTLEQAAGIFLDALSNTPYNNKPITDAQVITKELLKFLSDAYSYNPNAINEQKPAWSEEDERNLQGIIDEIEANKNHAPDYDLATYDRFISWLKSLKERVQLQPKQEWSEKDKCMLNNVIDTLKPLSQTTHSGYAINSMINWLKSLKPQTTWRPSEEQLESIRVAGEIGTTECPWTKGFLKEIYEQLKKLREGKRYEKGNIFLR